MGAPATTGMSSSEMNVLRFSGSPSLATRSAEMMVPWMTSRSIPAATSAGVSACAFCGLTRTAVVTPASRMRATAAPSDAPRSFLKHEDDAIRAAVAPRELELTQFRFIKAAADNVASLLPAVERMYGDIYHFVASWLPDYARDNRNYLTVAIGCTGGRHRSVYVARTMAARLAAAGYDATVVHRDRHGDVDSDIRACLINHADYSERNTNLSQLQSIWQRHAANNVTDWVSKPDDFLGGIGDCLDACLVETTQGLHGIVVRPDRIRLGRVVARGHARPQLGERFGHLVFGHFAGETFDRLLFIRMGLNR